MDTYIYTGREKHLFDFNSEFIKGDKVRILRKDLYLYNNNYPFDYAWIEEKNYDPEPDSERRYRIINQNINLNNVLNHTQPDRVLYEHTLFKESELELYA